MKKNNLHKKALSIIEIMVGIFIFTLGISAVFMVINSTSNINLYNKNKIIASNLSREQIELIRNIRDTNYVKLQKWNILDPYTVDWSNPNIPPKIFTGSTTKFYKFETDFSSPNGKINASLEAAVSDFKTELKTSTAGTQKYRLCLDSDNRYVYCPTPMTPDVIQTPFYRYIEILPLEDKRIGGHIVADAFKIRSRVFWNQKGIHDTEISTILADWKRL